MSAKLVGFFTGDYSLRRPHYVKYMLLWDKAVYPFVNDPYHPLTYHCPDGSQLRPAAVMDTDMGTVPRSVRVLISKDRFLDSYILHDSGYEHEGWSVSRDGGKKWKHEMATRGQVDAQLRECIRAQGGGRGTRNAVYSAVRSAGGGIWRRRHKGRKG